MPSTWEPRLGLPQAIAAYAGAAELVGTGLLSWASRLLTADNDASGLPVAAIPNTSVLDGLIRPEESLAPRGRQLKGGCQRARCLLPAGHAGASPAWCGQLQAGSAGMDGPGQLHATGTVGLLLLHGEARSLLAPTDAHNVTNERKRPVPTARKASLATRYGFGPGARPLELAPRTTTSPACDN